MLKAPLCHLLFGYSSANMIGLISINASLIISLDGPDSRVIVLTGASFLILIDSFVWCESLMSRYLRTNWFGFSSQSCSKLVLSLVVFMVFC